jgi:hypothetical protein
MILSSGMLRTPEYPCPLTRSRSVTSASGNRESDRAMIIYNSLSCALVSYVMSRYSVEHRRREVCFPIGEIPLRGLAGQVARLLARVK